MYVVLFTLTVLVSAVLLFSVQPMVGKMILPLLGGAPAVWNACMLFFQTCLLIGYCWAHVSTRVLGVRRQAVVQVVLLLLPLLVLPVAIPQGWIPPAGSNPTGWLLLLLLVMVGLPFMVLAGTAPLVQSWFSSCAPRESLRGDPYFLYSASNMGSLLALIGYPLVIEPVLTLGQQSRLWSITYGALIAIMTACAAVVVTRGAPAVARSKQATEPVTWRERARWLALSAVPSSYLLGLTTYLTSDIAAVPLLWMLPLVLYLLSFVIVFSRKPLISPGMAARALPITMVFVALWVVSGFRQPVWLIMGAHLVAFFFAAVACHGELARLRPRVAHLTEYYLVMSLGGVVGGLFNVLLAPLIFTTTAEYPTAMVAACMLAPGTPGRRASQTAYRGITLLLDIVPPLLTG
ncbi:MAG: spermidine synthase, partial [Tepidisphaeraceae bacterium]